MIINENNVLKCLSDVLEVELNNSDLIKTLDELEVDSILLVRMVVSCEMQFGIEFEDEMLLLSKFDNLKAIIDYVILRASNNYDE